VFETLDVLAARSVARLAGRRKESARVRAYSVRTSLARVVCGRYETRARV
jgi:hypothetical protein